MRGPRGSAALTDAFCINYWTDDPQATVYRPLPAPGNGYWFFVRGKNDCGDGSCDSGEPGQSGSRDPRMSQSPLACP